VLDAPRTEARTSLMRSAPEKPKEPSLRGVKRRSDVRSGNRSGTFYRK